MKDVSIDFRQDKLRLEWESRSRMLEFRYIHRHKERLLNVVPPKKILLTMAKKTNDARQQGVFAVSQVIEVRIKYVPSSSIS